jgi:DNA polymerase-1
LWDYEEIIAELKKITHTPPSKLYIDYETTGLKPQRPSSKIASIAFAYNDRVFAFLYDYKMTWTSKELERIGSHWRQVLLNEDIQFEGQNIKFEDNWSQVQFGARPANWSWDTMLAAHIMDNRSGITGLKFQAYKELGIDPYDGYIRMWLTGEPNTIEGARPAKLMQYNAYDALFGSMIAKKQQKRMHGRLLNAYRFFHGGVLAMSEVQLNGIPIDEDYYFKEELNLEAQIRTIKSTLLRQPMAQKYEKKTGRPLNLNSNKEIGYFLKGFSNITLEKTDYGNYIVDKKSLEKINIPFTKDLLHMRKLEKIHGTYLSQFRREGVNGNIYPFFDLHIPVSYRSSSSKPNFQNIPVRDEDAKRICRGGIYPSKGNQLLEIDYKGIEVCISACYHKGPKMIEYITDPTTDMHRDAAMDIWMLKEVSETIRFYAKNCWVFPQFYGSYYTQCAKELWDNCINLPLAEPYHDPDVEKIKKKLKESVGEKYVTLKQHLGSKGVHGMMDFERHCRRAEKKFWDRFSVYRDWKDEINSFYRKNGFIETHMGFKCRGIMSEKEATNYQIQGTAFHCLLWLLIELLEIGKREGWKTKIIGQIHDSIVFDLDPPEKDHVLKTTKDIGTIKIRQQFPWIIVPLQIDAEITPIDGSWYTKEKIQDASTTPV